MGLNGQAVVSVQQIIDVGGLQGRMVQQMKPVLESDCVAHGPS